MKIEATQPNALLQRMREAAEGQEPQAGSIGAASVAAGSEPIATKTLMAHVRATAERALRGEFANANEIREVVLEQILRERWAEQLGRSEVARMLRTLKPALADDPEFSRQVDELLILAAREAGQP